LAAEQHLVVEIPSARTIVCPVLTNSAHHPSVDPERLPWESSSAESQVLNKLNSSGVSVALAGFCGRAIVAQPAGVLRNYLNYFYTRWIGTVPAINKTQNTTIGKYVTQNCVLELLFHNKTITLVKIW